MHTFLVVCIFFCTFANAFGNKVAKNDASVIGRLVPPLFPRTRKAPQKVTNFLGFCWSFRKEINSQ